VGTAGEEIVGTWLTFSVIIKNMSWIDKHLLLIYEKLSWYITTLS
jgi:hypothetical protein